MRLLHTSDWHLGQSLHHYDRHFEHQRFLDWLLDTLVSEEADALLIAGDVFDNANPSAAAQRQLYAFLRQARQRAPRLDIVLIAGNHDSPGRIEAPGPLLEGLGVTVVGVPQYEADGAPALERMLVPLTGKDGQVAAWCLAVPFLRHGDVPRPPAPAAADAPQPDPYLWGIADLYRQALAHAVARRAPGQAIVAMGHCHMVDGQMSADSERRIVIGGTEMLPAGIFPPPVAYAALGHLHLAQQVGPHAHLRYCGSPIPLSFAETRYQHQVLRVDLEGESLAGVTPLYVPRAVPLLRIPAEPAPPEQALAELAALELPPAPPEEQALLEVRVRLSAPEPGLRAQVEQAIAGKPVRLAKIEASSARRPALDAAAASREQLAMLQPQDIFQRLYRERYGCEAPPDQLAAFGELLLP